MQPKIRPFHVHMMSCVYRPVRSENNPIYDFVLSGAYRRVTFDHKNILRVINVFKYKITVFLNPVKCSLFCFPKLIFSRKITPKLKLRAMAYLIFSSQYSAVRGYISYFLSTRDLFISAVSVPFFCKIFRL